MIDCPFCIPSVRSVVNKLRMLRNDSVRFSCILPNEIVQKKIMKNKRVLNLFTTHEPVKIGSCGSNRNIG